MRQEIRRQHLEAMNEHVDSPHFVNMITNGNHQFGGGSVNGERSKGDRSLEYGVETFGNNHQHNGSFTFRNVSLGAGKRRKKPTS